MLGLPDKLASMPCNNRGKKQMRNRNNKAFHEGLKMIWIIVAVIIVTFLAGRFIRVGMGEPSAREFTDAQIAKIEKEAKARRP